MILAREYRNRIASISAVAAQWSFLTNHARALLCSADDPGLRLRDMNFAFKLVRRRLFDHITLESEGSFIDVELLARAQRRGFHIVQFGVDYFPRSRGVSTLSSNSVIIKIIREALALRSELLSIQPLPPELIAGRRRH